MPGVIVDTSVWVDYLRGIRNPATDAVDRLLETGEALVCGVVEAELVSGLRTQSERTELMSLLEGCDFVEAQWLDWRRAGELAGQLRTRGRLLPLSDLVIAALAIGRGCAVLTADRHFQHIPGVTLLALE
jgi:predicted nucleic acid-binding protein